MSLLVFNNVLNFLDLIFDCLNLYLDYQIILIFCLDWSWWQFGILPNLWPYVEHFEHLFKNEQDGFLHKNRFHPHGQCLLLHLRCMIPSDWLRKVVRKPPIWEPSFHLKVQDVAVVQRIYSNVLSPIFSPSVKH